MQNTQIHRHTEIKYEQGIGGATHDRGLSFLEAAELILNNLSPKQIQKIKSAEPYPLREGFSALENKDNFQLLNDHIARLKEHWGSLEDKKETLNREDLAALEKVLIETLRNNVYVGKPPKFKKVKDELDNAENHVNWKKREAKEANIDDQNLMMSRSETPLSKFTPELTKEWLKIVNNKHENKPAWFKALPKWEQNYFIKRVEEWQHQVLSGKSGYVNLGDYLGPVPTTIRRYPGAPNAYLTKVELNVNGQSHSFTKVRSGVIAPVKVKNLNEKIDISKKNLEQLVVAAIQAKIQDAKDKPNKTIDLPILFQTLYSPPVQPPGDNNKAVMAAYDLLKKELANPDAFIKKHKIDTQGIKINKIDLLYSNRAVNKARGLSFVYNLFSKQGRENRNTVKALTRYVESLKGTEDYKMAKAALDSYKQMPYIWNTLRAPKNANNNAQAEKAGLEQVIMNLVGIRVGSCVSGKDREEMITQIAIAQQAFFLEHGKFPPPYNATSKENKALRDDFEEKVARQYLTGHGHLLAAENSRGCDGLKNIVDVLGIDICKKIKQIAPEYGIDPKVFDPVKDVQKVAGLNKLSEDKLNNKKVDAKVIELNNTVKTMSIPQPPALSSHVTVSNKNELKQAERKSFVSAYELATTQNMPPIDPAVKEAIEKCIRDLKDLKVDANVVKYVEKELTQAKDLNTSAKRLETEAGFKNKPENPLASLRTKLSEIGSQKLEDNQQLLVMTPKKLN